MKYDEDLNVPMIAMGSLIFVVGIMTVVVIGQGLFYSLNKKEKYVKEIAPMPEEFVKYTIDQEGKLNGYAWVDKKNGIVHIPIEDAMRITAAELEAERTGGAQ